MICQGFFRAEIVSKVIESALRSVEARCELFRPFCIRFNGLGLHHAREREASCMIEPKRVQCRALLSTPRAFKAFGQIRTRELRERELWGQSLGMKGETQESPIVDPLFAEETAILKD